MTAKPHPKDSVYEAAMRHISEISPTPELQSLLRRMGEELVTAQHWQKAFSCSLTLNFVYQSGELRGKTGK